MSHQYEYTNDEERMYKALFDMQKAESESGIFVGCDVNHTDTLDTSGDTKPDTDDDDVIVDNAGDIVKVEDGMITLEHFSSNIEYGNVKRQTPSVIYVRTDEGLRIYFTADTSILDESTCSGLVQIFLNAEEGEVIELVLGSLGDTREVMAISALLSAITLCKAKVIAYCDGPCSVLESYIWLWCSERHVSTYGALYFGGYEFATQYPLCKNALDLSLNKALELGVLTDNEVSEIKKKKIISVRHKKFSERVNIDN